ncbi:hypothetical protein CALCODRAFT_543757 [Calocera cornea HHB12733]|uniref:Uncharacterized protein n=1 Tax=Calocera cornea HHB12733 TaxID=1353952 RepID=A0A165FA21_9BASI|nr:hypothetical protein CALCODRAFT_543757 [Calocera cornea HHB12733]
MACLLTALGPTARGQSLTHLSTNQRAKMRHFASARYANHPVASYLCLLPSSSSDHRPPVLVMSDPIAQRQHYQTRIKTRLNGPVAKLVNAAADMLQLRPLASVNDPSALYKLIIAWSDVVHVDAILRAAHELRTHKHPVPMDAGKGLAVKQLPDSYHQRYTSFAHLKTGSRPGPANILDETGRLKLYYRQGGIVHQAYISWQDRMHLAFGLLCERMFLLFGVVPTLFVDPTEKHLLFQRCVRRIWRQVHKFQEALEIEMNPGPVELLLLQHCVHARQVMAIFDTSEDDTVLSSEYLPTPFLHFALGRVPARWLSAPPATRKAAEKGSWWNWTGDLRNQALVAMLDAQYGRALIDSIIVAPQWENRPNPISVQLYIRLALDYVLCLCHVKPHALMNKNLQLLLEQLSNLQAITPGPPCQLPIPINILPMETLPAYLLERCTKMDILDPLSRDALDIHYWQWKIDVASKSQQPNTDQQIIAVSAVLGLLFASFDEDAVESMGNVINHTSMKLLHRVRSAISQGQTWGETFAPDVLLVPLHIRQQYTNAYKHSDADQLQESARYLRHPQRKALLPPDPPTQDGPILPHSDELPVPTVLATSRQHQELPVAPCQVGAAKAIQTGNDEVQLHEVSDGSFIPPRHSSQHPPASARPHNLHDDADPPMIDPRSSHCRPQHDSAEEHLERPHKKPRTEIQPLTDDAPPSTIDRRPNAQGNSRRRRQHDSTEEVLERPRNRPRTETRETPSYSPIPSVWVSLENDPERALYPYYLRKTFKKRAIFTRKHTRPTATVRSWCEKDRENCGTRIEPKKLTPEECTGPLIRQFGLVEVQWKREQPTTWRHGPYRCQTCQRKKLFYKDRSKSQLMDDLKHLEYAFMVLPIFHGIFSHSNSTILGL